MTILKDTSILRGLKKKTYIFLFIITRQRETKSFVFSFVWTCKRINGRRAGEYFHNLSVFVKSMNSKD
jgi:hypothetical protein